MKIYVTKYLFTDGIQEMEAEADPRYPGMASAQNHGTSYQQNFHGKEWHKTRDEAVAHAKVMRDRKLASIDKQRKKIADMVIG